MDSHRGSSDRLGTILFFRKRRAMASAGDPDNPNLHDLPHDYQQVVSAQVAKPASASGQRPKGLGDSARLWHYGECSAFGSRSLGDAELWCC